MNFLYDDPIKCESDDLLNRTKFARDFALNLLSIPKEKNMTISINGEWGSGKTSLINLIKAELKKELSKKRSIADKSNFYYHIVDFAPWNTLDENAIINQFFNTLISNFSEEKVKVFLKSEYYKGFISIAKEIPKVGIIFKGMDVLLKKYSKSFLKGDENLLEIKEKINKKLLSLPGKFIIFIDDIDRLNKKEIKLLIQLIKAVFDFPNIIYILSFDKKIVSDALSEEQNVTGEEYLEKIIQLSVNMPQIEESVLHNYLFAKLNRVLSDNNIVEFDSSRWGYVFNGGYADYFKTLRKINRYINSINLKQNRYLDIVDCVDFFVIEAISLFEPNLLNLVRMNRDLLCKENYEDNKDRIEIFKSNVNDISNKYNLLTYLFPILQNNKFGYYSKGSNYKVRKINGRICIKEYFDFYFNGVLNSGFVSKMEVRDYLKMKNSFDRKSFINSLNNKSFSDFLRMLYYYIDDMKNISELNLESIFDAIECETDFKKITRFISPNNEIWFNAIIDKYILVINDEKLSMILLKDLISKTNNLKFLVNLMYHLCKDTALYYDNKNTKEGIIKYNNLLKLHDMVVEKIREYINDKKSLFDKNLVYLIHFVKIRDSLVLEEWFKTLNITDINNIIVNFYYVGYGESSTRFLTYRFDFESISEYIELDKVTQYLKNKLIGNEVYAEIGEVLFLMPPCANDDNYQIDDLYKYCIANNIKFNKTDEFVDE